MGRIHVLAETVANKIAAGEVVERPASVVKELMENALDAGSTRIKIQVEGGGRKLIHVSDNGCGMVRDDALLAFERHATSKITNAEDLLNVATLGFRGEALPSIAAVSRLRLETRAADQVSGTAIEIQGGKIFRVEEAGLPQGSSITVRDLFFNTPARKKFLRSESTELGHIAGLVTHYALAHPEKHFELHSVLNAMLVTTPAANHSERVYQVLGGQILDELLPLEAVLALDRCGLPAAATWPWRAHEDQPLPDPGRVCVHGFVSKPEIQKLNRNSIFVFVNGRMIRDRLIQHALTEAYRNVLPPMLFPVVLLFLEMPAAEVDVNVHPSKTEVRFRQQGIIHDFVRDSIRATLMKARPAPQFTTEIYSRPTGSSAVSAPWPPRAAEATRAASPLSPLAQFALSPPPSILVNDRFRFEQAVAVESDRAASLQAPEIAGNVCAPPFDDIREDSSLAGLASLKALGQIRNSFILAVNQDGLWIIDQHVAHERVLFEKLVSQRSAHKLERQHLLMPLLLELTPTQQALFGRISHELELNGFEAEPFGTRTIAVKTAPAGLDRLPTEHLLQELLEELSRDEQSINLENLHTQIAASIACHAAIKVNMPLEQSKMEWLLVELARTEFPMSCPHGRPIVLRYSLRDIQRAFKRI